MKKKTYTLVKLNDDVEIIAIGDYVPAEEETNFPGQFDITKIEIAEGTLMQYTDFVEDFSRNYPDILIIDHFNELALLKLQKNV